MSRKKGSKNKPKAVIAEQAKVIPGEPSEQPADYSPEKVML